ncbi:unnamed protein product [Jaminaea pallidilutea]
MKTFAAVSAFVALAVSAQAATVQSPPQLIQCQPAAISWTGAQGDVFLSIVQGKDTSAAPLEQFPQQSGASGSYSWTVDQPSGTQLTFVINDSTGKPNYSSQVTVSQGQSNDCLDSSSSASSSSSSSSSGSSDSDNDDDDDSSSSAAGASSTAASGGSSTRSASSSATSAASSGGSSGAGMVSANGLVAAAAGAAAAFFMA